jgi:signal transduction histidine kinase
MKIQITPTGIPGIPGRGGPSGRLSERDRRQRLERASASCRRLARLIENLFDVSRTGTVLPSVEREEVDLATLAREVVERFATAARLAACELKILVDRPVIGRWDPRRLDQILTNLLANAFTHARGTPIERQNATAMGGAVALESAPGRGATFRVELPLT